MKHITVLACLTLALTIFPAPLAVAQDREIAPGVNVGGQMRLRTESRRNFKFDPSARGNDETIGLSRVRLRLAWKPADIAEGVVEFQDARLYNAEAISATKTPNIFADRLDVHQAYLDLRAPEGAAPKVNVRVGRQKLSYGSQRLISPLEWVNTARVFDGAKVSMGVGDGRTIDGFGVRLVPVSPEGLNDHRPTGSRLFNSQLYGVYLTDRKAVARTTLEGYWLLRRFAQARDAVQTLGARVDTARGPWSLDGEAAFQAGEWGGMQQRALMLHLGGSVAVTPLAGTRIGGAFNLGSGDDDPDDGVHRTFDNLYPLNHAFYGYMDFFALQNLRNLELTAEVPLPGGVTARIALQDFDLAEPGADVWYNAGAGIVRAASAGTAQSTDAALSSDVGREIDFTLRVPATALGIGAGFELGYSRFVGGAYMRQAEFAALSADFFYFQTIVGF